MNTALEPYRQLDAVRRTYVNLGGRQQVEGLLPVAEITENSQDIDIGVSGQGQMPGVVISAADLNLNADISVQREGSPLYFQSTIRKKKRKWHHRLPNPFTMVFLGINFVFLCFGIALIAVGAVSVFGVTEISVLVNFNLEASLEPGSVGIVQMAMLILMICGLVIFIISILGVCGLWRRNTYMLYAYCILLGCLLVTKLVIASFAFYFQEYLSTKLSKPLQKLLHDNYDGKRDSTNIKSRAVDYAQVLLGCCGMVSYKDFVKSKWHSAQIGSDLRKAFPLTCCRLKDKERFLRAPTEYNLSAGLNDPNCPYRVASADNEFTGVPCDQKLKQLLEDQASIIYFVGLAVVCLEFIGIFFANGLISDIKKG